MALQVRPTVLLIEDNLMNMKMFTVLIKSLGYGVIEAVDGTEGLALARERQPDLIVADWWLPGAHGLALIRALKEHEKTRHIPVIVTTAHFKSADHPEVQASGCDCFLAKPISVAAFIKMLKAFLPQAAVPG